MPVDVCNFGRKMKGVVSWDRSKEEQVEKEVSAKQSANEPSRIKIFEGGYVQFQKNFLFKVQMLNRTCPCQRLSPVIPNKWRFCFHPGPFACWFVSKIKLKVQDELAGDWRWKVEGQRRTHQPWIFLSHCDDVF